MLAEAYQKYLYVPRPVSKRYPMDVQHRAKQFAPFAALRGFEEIVRKQEILYEQRKMLSEEQKCGLDRKLQMVSVGMKIQATYFKESREMKPAGQYHTICGTVEFFDPSIHCLLYTSHVDLAANYGWHQVFYVCFVDFLGKAWLHWLCIL